MTPFEDDILIAFFDWVRVKAQSDPRYELIIHVPNEAKRSWWLGRRMKRKGIASGIPDILVLYPSKGFNGLAVELKRTPKLHATENQITWLNRLTKYNWHCALCFTADAAMGIVENYIDEVRS
jgi:hypothetical protein